MTACAQYFGVITEDLTKHCRGSLSIMLARKVAMYLSRKLTYCSWPELGRKFRRHHSTILVVTRHVSEDRGLLDIARKIEESIT